MPSPPRLLAVTPPAPGAWLHQVASLRERGVDGLLLRLVQAPEAVPAVVEELVQSGALADLRVLLRVQGDGESDLALARSHGLGLHLPARLDPGAWRDRAPAGLLSVACHDGAELARARSAGADLALLSPVRSPGSKPDDTRAPLGLEAFGELARSAGLPVLALGGMGPGDLGQVQALGGWGVAGIGAFWRG